ncbi:FG-GAP-like repeat-containing protein [Aestuariimicrobium sp. Y1814]|uniref:FG-GAP-like repeat-containing protein n=1 Tax=Aestuariimicrobium sp. Y1814 TaxID=3418742 RepID=UPI003DA7353A
MSTTVPTAWRRRVAALATSLALVATLLVQVAPPARAAYDERKGPNNTNRVTLTYDDCPTSLSAFRAVVLAAEQLDIGLALLPTGNCISAGRFDAAFARAHGHYVFNHSINHPDLTTLSFAGVQRELGSPGVVTSFGRPPYGAINSTVRSAYASVGMQPWLWNVDTNDWQGKSQSQVVSYVVNNTRAGNSVLMHMQWNGFSASALSQMKAGLNARGIGVCRNFPGTTPVRPATMDCDAGGSTQPPPPPPPPAPVFGDENGDQRADVLAVGATGSLLLYHTNANLTLGPARVTGQGWTQMNWMSRVPDVTGDGLHDLLARRSDGNLFFYPGRGGGHFGAAVQVGNGWGSFSKLVVMPDVTGDGRPELFAVDSADRLQSYRITATGLSHQGQLGTGWGDNIRFLTTVGNSSGGTNADLLAVASNGDLLSYTTGAGGVIVGVNKVGRGWTTFDAAFSPGDLNNDGRRDLVGRRADGRLFAYRHLGGGQFSAATQMGTGWSAIRMFA